MAATRSDDTLWGVNRRRKGAANTLAALRSIRAARPDGAPIYVILDNLSAHKGETIRRWAKKNKVELCFTPTYASWANPIEAHFGPLRQFTVANSHRRSHPAQTRALRLPAPAQRQRPAPRRPSRPAQGTRTHPQRKRHPLGRTSPDYRSLTRPWAAVTAADDRAVDHLTCAAMVRAHSIASACVVSTSRS